MSITLKLPTWKPFYLSNKILVDLLPWLPLLRILSLSHFYIRKVPNFIGSLKHLRYLNLSQTQIEELPETFGNLYNLQTLIVSGCEWLTKLPKSFLNLKKLRHFDIRDTPNLEKLPLGIGECTPTKIIVGGVGGFAITELKGLWNLHGKVSIKGLHNVQSAMHAREANLCLRRFTKLELKWGYGSQTETLEKEVLNELKPNNYSLKELAIVSYGGINFPNWVGDLSFHHLVHVSIRGCRKCTSLPPLGQLPSLKELYIQGMDEVKVIGSELAGTSVVVFPSLEILKFEDMSGWVVWSTNSKVSDVVFPCLRELRIRKCPKLSDVSLDSLPLLRVLEIKGCGDGVLRSLVRAASSISKFEISSISRLTDEVWRGAIKYLGAVEEVRIMWCDELRYLWESEADASKVFVNLKELHVYFCSNLVSLGEKDEAAEEEDNYGRNLLSSLWMLDVSSCDSMKRLRCPNSIRSLRIHCCKSVTSVSFSTAVTGGGGQKLKILGITNSNRLTVKINNTSMPMLESLYINGSTNLRSVFHWSNFDYLRNLHIRNCQNIESFPDIQLPNLTSLTLEMCYNVKSLPDLHLMSLTSLRISFCANLKSFPNIQLPNLTSLEIVSCENLESFPDIQLPNLTLLKQMTFKNCPNIDASFPRGYWPPKLHTLIIGKLKKPISEWGIQNFPTSLVALMLLYEPQLSNFSQLSNLFPSSLTTLAIIEFDKLESLSMGLQHLTSLQHLQIGNCPKMKRLPKMLLPSLLCLRIYYSPNLEERCNGRGSHYWPLISHIPCIQITK